MANLRLQLGSLMQEHMSRQLARLNMPSRDDIAALGKRMMEVDERLIRIEDKLQNMEPRNEMRDQSQTRKRPPRTKRPDTKKSGQAE